MLGLKVGQKMMQLTSEIDHCNFYTVIHTSAYAKQKNFVLLNYETI